MQEMKRTHFIGLDVGSTTVKAVVVDTTTDAILWQDYQRHDTKQPEKVLEFLERIESETKLSVEHFRVFITGSGGNGIASMIGAKFVQEVNAVSLAVEKLYPETGSVIELGGQDAKIIIFKEDQETGKKKKIPSMNDKCAGGTGAVIDKINAKLRIPAEKLSQLGYNGIRLHPVAGKCGVFAETDINGLQKQGVPPDELMASLFESIIQQNLSVLTRGHTLRPFVLLLGGPNTFIKGMVDCWKYNIPLLWEERNFPLPDGINPADLIIVPNNAQYFAALGAIEFGREEEEGIGEYKGVNQLSWFINHGREEKKRQNGRIGLARSEEELQRFKAQYALQPFTPATLQPGTVFEAYLGIDGGSTSTKGVLLDRQKHVAFKAYQLSKGNPIEDTMHIISLLHAQVRQQDCELKILGVGTTGYAKDILKDTIGGDVALVETVSHTQAALHFYDHVDVICDVGGQDIKIIVLKDGRVVDFKLNTQCSAGNGYFLQSTAEGFGYPVEQFADIAFGAKGFPDFGYGCAVFMQSDIVDFQRQGWKPEEIMAGLANVLPKNIWLYVSQIPNLAKLGSTFVLQGGTQHNLAAVKSQVDFIQSRFRGKGIEPRIIVHKHTGEAGAIGCAVEAARLHAMGVETRFIGLTAVASIKYSTTRSEDTRCYFCKNKCLRTFIDVETNDQHRSTTDTFEYKSGPELIRSARFESEAEHENKFASKVPLTAGANRLIIATCEKGTVEDVNDMRAIAKGLNETKKLYPNLVETASKEVWNSFKPQAAPLSVRGLFHSRNMQERQAQRNKRARIQIGIPRALNMYAHTPFFTAYFESLGIPYANITFSDYTTEELYKEGSKRGSIDPCFPSKVSLAHVHNLLFKKHPKTPLNWIFFPIVDDMPTDLYAVQASKSCPTITGTVETIKAAFVKEGDLFHKSGIKYMNPFLSLGNKELVSRQLYEYFKPYLHLDEDENTFAVQEGYKALDVYSRSVREKSAKSLQQLEQNNGIGIVLLGRPYHNDPGINHEILDEFQKLGYPIFSQDSLPIDEKILGKLFGEEVKAKKIAHPMDIRDVWKNSYSENTSRKVWAAKFVARHPNLVALELSSFKCGHDAPIYSIVQEIVECSGTPYFSFKDIDENKPSGSIKIRVETINYFLRRYKENLLEDHTKRLLLEERLSEYENRLRAALAHPDYHRYSLGLSENFNRHSDIIHISLTESTPVMEE